MFAIEYTLTGVGWSECIVHAEQDSAHLSASYLGDALGDLARAVLAIAQGDGAARCSFDEEPGEYRWLFEQDGPWVAIRILWFDDLWGEEPDHRRKPVLDTPVRRDDLIRATADALRRVHDEHGPDGYHEQWVEHPFPMDEYEALNALRSGN